MNHDDRAFSEWCRQGRARLEQLGHRRPALPVQQAPQTPAPPFPRLARYDEPQAPPGGWEHVASPPPDPGPEEDPDRWDSLW